MYSSDRIEEALMKAFPLSEAPFSSVTLVFPDGSSASSNPTEGSMTRDAAMPLRLATQQCREHARVADSYAEFFRLPEILRNSPHSLSPLRWSRPVLLPPTTLVVDVWRAVIEFLDVDVIVTVPWWGQRFFEARNELLWGVLYSRFCGRDAHRVSSEMDYRSELMRLYRSTRGPPALSSYVMGLEFGTVLIGAKKFSVTGCVAYPMKLMIIPRYRDGPILAQVEFVGDVLLITILPLPGWPNMYQWINHKAVESVKIAVSEMLKVCF